MYTHNNPLNFTQREIAAGIQVWNRAAVSLLDIRHNLISPKEAICNYRLPASAFLYTSGRGEIALDDTVYHADRFDLFHGGKGTQLSIRPRQHWFEYYMVLYKTEEPPVHKREFAKLLEQCNPFRQQYGFKPQNPLLFADQLKKMFECWKDPTALNLFYGKAGFYPFVYAVYEELERGNVRILEPDVVSMAVRYLETNFQKDVAIQELCAMLGVSYSHFHRLFKRKTEKTPQEYLIHRRLRAARAYLQNSSASVREIAERCGFIDESSFYRLFTKNEGQSPGLYREVSQSLMRDSTIEKVFSFPYNEESQVSVGELKGKGVTFMTNQMRSKAVIAAALSLLLMMSACGTTTAGSSGGDTTPTTAATTQMAETETTVSAEEGTRTISTAMGDAEIPQNPKRILATLMEGDLIAFGVEPAAIMDVGIDYEKTPFHESLVGLSSINAEDMEAVMAAEPDVIITYSPELYEKFSKIAPTLLVDASGMDIYERTRMIGELLNQQDKAEELIAALDKRISELRQKLEEAGLADKTVTIMEGAGSGEVWITTSGRGSIPLYNLLGFQMSQKVEEELSAEGNWLNQWLKVSLEVLPAYVGDYVFFSDQLSLDEVGLTDNPVWESVAAVKQGHVYMSSFPYFFPQDIYSVMKQMDFIESVLLED